MLAVKHAGTEHELDFRPLQITFRMRTPVNLTYPFIFLDGIVAHLMNRYLDPEGYRALPSKRVVKEASDVDIPIKKLHIPNKGYIYHASVSIFDRTEAYTTKVFKRFCEKYFDFNKVRKKRIDRRRGFFKDFSLQYVYIPARKVTFYACGDADALEFLLSGLPGIGKRTSIGFGMIKDYSIKEISKDFSIVKRGVAMRAIPIEVVKYAEEIVPMAYKPPYWSKEVVTPCVPPFARVELQ